jgi:DNA polymerase-3 subunit delta'
MARLQHPDVKFIIPLPRGSGEGKDDGPLDKLTASDLETVREQLAQKAANPYHRITVPRATIIKINSIREIRRDVSMGSADGRSKVFIIAGADAMGDEASNTLLKTLEEPTGECLFLLTTSRRDALLPTIISRCQEIRFDPLTEDEIAGALTDRNGVPAEKAALVARLANGSYTRAAELLGDDLQEEREHVVSFLRAALGAQVLNLGKQIERVTEGNDRESVHRFLLLQMMWFRDALVLRHGGNVINIDQMDDLRRFVDRFGDTDLHGAIAEVERAISLLGRNVYIKLVLLQLAVRLKSILKRPA